MGYNHYVSAGLTPLAGDNTGELTMKTASATTQAYWAERGRMAYERGDARVPAAQADVIGAMGEIGTNTVMLKAWLAGWDSANMEDINHVQETE